MSVNAAHIAKIRKFLEEAKATKNRREIMIWTKSLRAIARGLLTNAC